MATPRRKTWLTLGLLALVIGARLLGWEPEAPADDPGVAAVGAPTAEIGRLVDERRSGVMVEAEGRVVAVLSDDLQGSRHQRLLVGLASGGTVLIAHNIDLAPRVEDVRKGDQLVFRGQYEWNEKGGVVHWTHRDPDRRHEEGFIRHEGRTYH